MDNMVVYNVIVTTGGVATFIQRISSDTIGNPYFVVCDTMPYHVIPYFMVCDTMPCGIVLRDIADI